MSFVLGLMSFLCGLWRNPLVEGGTGNFEADNA